ncbi:MAG: hypothetical protein V1862_02035 [Methanobacteriota archaeon]
MFKRISELFKGKKNESKANNITALELPAWLDNEEKTCVDQRSDRINHSRDVVDKARSDILQLLKDFGSEDTEEPLHPKVEQVNRHNLPQFKRKIEAALDQEFSDDDEVYYRQVAELIDGCFKAYEGPGRYLHHLYGEEVKLFRQSMDQIGRELNHLTDMIKISRTRIGKIEAIRSALARYKSAREEALQAAGLQEEMETRREGLVAAQRRITDERDAVAMGEECTEYNRRCAALDVDSKRISVLYENVESLVRTASPVWRRVFRLVQDERHRDEEKLLDRIIQESTLQKYEDPEFLSNVSSTAAIIFRYIENEGVPIRNSFEKSLFSSPDAYVEQISSAVTTWQNADHAMQEEKHLLATHPTAVCLGTFNSRIDEIARDIRHIDEEAGKNQGRSLHIDREKADAMKIIAEEMHELTGGTIAVQGIESEPMESA